MMGGARLPVAAGVVLALVVAQVILPATLDLITSVALVGVSSAIGFRVGKGRAAP